MISLESQVLERHLSFFNGKSVLFAGGISDNFPQTLTSKCQSIQIWSCYFDYARTQSAVNFSVEFQDQADLIVYYWTKNKQEVNFQLLQLLSQAPIGQEILIIGENRCGVRSVEKTLKPYGEIAKIDSARRCGLYHFSLQNKPHFELKNFWKTYQHSILEDLTIYSLPGVFSAAELDTGTELLLSTIDNKIKGKVLDLGCGAGVIGSMIKKRSPNTQITMTDIHAMALESARKTLSENQLQGEVYVSDVFSDIEGKFDLIISNPPFHDGIDTAYRAVTELITQAKWHLNQGGELRIVANAFLPYPELLRQHFNDYQVLAQTGKFKVYSVKN
ncbi:16S rRNA (guanine(1207)-N(2))-methyltransferase RsmC [Haemophilus influenzae]|uniref:16S rRNA (guanine(1207)-N(2))-methyltransferase RsmC n=1 Tax=Haemophilus influenzae TaxID=727 RepID=UPI00067FA0F3|nr:16S rRNA (guanine(1207)-N(2))-methyltransferase RsmC [Haemophilus influenzae]AVJ02369.1 16S rRNA m2G1207 methyltransferase [Haemophilus influenzae]AVJ04111.1 16S rRNA m2G1207 methyltransferase [Haemophilus influenzae]KMZ36139.1 MFS transporter [Haemophilus influenzae]MCK8799198.1 16S rRNA (guanine(1207)-N(2))-methyltransferase RsmC [Haemophilus influenzae]MCK8889794.1 16S rRNA (guanine(1207)-N(2))-methyltransferase RsmC [Haemophilus influenzae]